MLKIGKRLAYLGLGILILALAACASPTELIPDTGDGQTPGPATPVVSPEQVDVEDALANTPWQLVSFGEPGAETPVVEGTTVTLEFGADGQVSGSGGCNSYGGVYQVQGDSLSFGEIVSTLMACADERIMQQEQQYFEALQSAGQFELVDDRLAIRYGDGAGVLNYVPGSSPTPAPTGVTPPISPASTPTPASAGTPVRTEESSAEDATPNALGSRVEFEPGATSATLSGTLPAGGTRQYMLRGAAGQVMEVQTTGYNAPVNFTVRSPGGETWTGEPAGSEVYIYTTLIALLEDGDHVVTLLVPAGAGATRYDVTFTISAGAMPSPSEPPERVNFASGAISAQRSDLLPTGPGLQQYVLEASAGQVMTIELDSGGAPLGLTIASPAGATWSPKTLPADGGYRATETLTLPETGDYLVTLTKPDHTPSTNYQVVFTIGAR